MRDLIDNPSEPPIPPPSVLPIRFILSSFALHGLLLLRVSRLECGNQKLPQHLTDIAPLFGG
jgi:hypothetical protein